MNVRPRAAAGIAEQRNLVTDGNLFTFIHGHLIQVAIPCHDTVTMVDFNQSAVVCSPARKCHDATGGGKNMLLHWTGKV